jgi:hypothetical protein
MSHSPRKWENGAFHQALFVNRLVDSSTFDFQKCPMPHKKGKMGHLKLAAHK